MKSSLPRLALLATAGAAACSLVYPLEGFRSPSGELDSPDGEGPDGKAPDGEAPADGASQAPSDAGPDGAVDDPDLVAEWWFDEGSGTVAYARGGGHPLTLLGGSWTDARPGSRGSAIKLDGSLGPQITGETLKGSAFPRSGTLSIHFRRPQIDTVQRAIFSGFYLGADHLFVRHPNGTTPDAIQVGFQIADAATPYAFAASFVDEGGAWRHVVTTWNEATRVATVFVDGKSVAVASYVVAFAPTSQDITFGHSWLGEIDDVRLYSRALSPAEITEIP